MVGAHAPCASPPPVRWQRRRAAWARPREAAAARARAVGALPRQRRLATAAAWQRHPPTRGRRRRRAGARRHKGAPPVRRQHPDRPTIPTSAEQQSTQRTPAALPFDPPCHPPLLIRHAPSSVLPAAPPRARHGAPRVHCGGGGRRRRPPLLRVDGERVGRIGGVWRVGHPRVYEPRQ